MCYHLEMHMEEGLGGMGFIDVVCLGDVRELFVIGCFTIDFFLYVNTHCYTYTNEDLWT